MRIRMIFASVIAAGMVLGLGAGCSDHKNDGTTHTGTTLKELPKPGLGGGGGGEAKPKGGNAPKAQ